MAVINFVVWHFYRPTTPNSYDHVCAKRCWYCKLRCNTCLSQASVGMSSRNAGRTQRFCSEVCQSVYFSNKPKEETLLDVFNTSSQHLLLLSFDIKLPRPLGDYSRADVSVYVCKYAEQDSFPDDSLYVVYHHATAVDQHFLEYFIHDDCSFSHMLHYYGVKDYPDMKYAINFASEILAEKLQELGTNLTMLLEFVENKT